MASLRGDTTTSKSKQGQIPVEQKCPRVVVQNSAELRGMTMLPSVGIRRILTVKYGMPLRAIPPHPEERQSQREFKENNGAGSAQSLCSQGSWNGGIKVAEAAAVAGEPMEGGDATVTMIMTTWNIGDPTVCHGKDSCGYDDDGEQCLEAMTRSGA